MTRSSYRAWCGVIGRVLPKPAALMREALSETLPVRIATGEIRAYLPVSSDEGMAAGSGTSLRGPEPSLWQNMEVPVSIFQESPLAGEPREILFHIHSVHRYQLCAKYLYPSTLL